MRKYPGVVVEPTRENLLPEELIILKWLYEHKGTSYKAWEIAGHFKHNIRKVVSALSFLTGMDLVISTKFTYCLNTLEYKFFKGSTEDEPHYFIRDDEKDVIQRRAFNAVNTNGKLHNLEFIQPDTHDMFPKRPLIKWDFTGVMTRFGNNDAMDGTEFTFETMEDIITLRDLILKKFRITVELID